MVIGKDSIIYIPKFILFISCRIVIIIQRKISLKFHPIKELWGEKKTQISKTEKSFY